MSLTLMKSDYIMALMRCARDCSEYIGMKGENASLSISKAQECRTACLDCVEAFESAQVAIRGLLIQSAAHACRSFLKLCEGCSEPISQKCRESCKRCIEESEYLMA